MDTFVTQVSRLAFTVCLKHIYLKLHFIVAFKWCAHNIVSNCTTLTRKGKGKGKVQLCTGTEAL